jgi:hypothetical protein
MFTFIWHFLLRSLRDLPLYSYKGVEVKIALVRDREIEALRQKLREAGIGD